MGINLQKGQRISLKKEAPGLERIMCGLGWDVAKNKSKGGLLSIFSKTDDFDLDAFVLCLDAEDRLKSKQDLIYFGNLRHATGAIIHLGDNLTGEGDGDDEEILIDLNHIPEGIHKLVLAVNIYKCFERDQEFSQIENAFIRLVNLSNNKEIVRYSLSGNEYQGKTGMIFAEIYRHKGEWKMAAIGTGLQISDLAELAKSYS